MQLGVVPLTGKNASIRPLYQPNRAIVQVVRGCECLTRSRGCRDWAAETGSLSGLNLFMSQAHLFSDNGHNHDRFRLRLRLRLRLMVAVMGVLGFRLSFRLFGNGYGYGNWYGRRRFRFGGTGCFFGRFLDNLRRWGRMRDGGGGLKGS